MKSRIDSILRGIQWLLLVVYCVLGIIMFINNDKGSLITRIFYFYLSIFIFPITLINLYGIYYSDWGGKQFDKWIGNWRRYFMLTKNKSTYIVLCKIGGFFGIAGSIVIFIMCWGIITK